jgi:ribosome-interacting GTPase 1
VPANLTPEYFKAEKWFRTAVGADEKILALEQMLRVMPKHKGTDHLRADLRRKLSKLRELPRKKAGGKQADVFYVPRNGAGQVAFLGLPNCGKSSIVAALTNAKVTVGNYPFATNVPVPGMLQFEDIQIQLVDTPPITADYIAPGQIGTYRNCDLIAVAADLSADAAAQLEVCLDFLHSRNLLIGDRTSAVDEQGNVLAKKAVCIGTKSDIAAPGAVETFGKSVAGRFESAVTSAAGRSGLEELPGLFFRCLGIIRIYAKKPGKKADMSEPFTLPAGSTVMDLALDIHRELATKLKYARIWGKDVYDGQNTQKTHVLNDGDIIELHFG